MIDRQYYILLRIFHAVEQMIAGARLGVNQNHSIVPLQRLLCLKGGDSQHMRDKKLGHGAIFGAANQSPVGKGILSIGQIVFKQDLQSPATGDGVRIGIIMHEDQRVITLCQQFH